MLSSKYYDGDLNEIEEPNLSESLLEFRERGDEVVMVLVPMTKEQLEQRERGKKQLAEQSMYVTRGDLDELRVTLFELIQDLNPLRRVDIPDSIAESYGRLFDSGAITELSDSIRARLDKLRGN